MTEEVVEEAMKNSIEKDIKKSENSAERTANRRASLRKFPTLSFLTVRCNVEGLSTSDDHVDKGDTA